VTTHLNVIKDYINIVYHSFVGRVMDITNNNFLVAFRPRLPLLTLIINDLKKCNLKPSAETWRILIREGLKSMIAKRELMTNPPEEFKAKVETQKNLCKGAAYEQMEHLINILKEAQLNEMIRMENNLKLDKL